MSHQVFEIPLLPQAQSTSPSVRLGNTRKKYPKKKSIITWRQTRIITVIGIGINLVLQTAAIIYFITFASNSKSVAQLKDLSDEMALKKCLEHNLRPQDLDQPAFHNPRGSQSRSILIRNANVWDGLGNVYNNYDMILSNGIIEKFGKNLECNRCLKEIDAAGRIVTPGLVDMHSHEGLSSWPLMHGSDDVNESTNPTLSQLKSLDSFNPHDASIYLTLTGGVTTSLVLPGSANVMGGEAYVFKNAFKSFQVEPMRFYYNDSNSHSQWRWMKMAVGENPKGTYGADKGEMPETRMGVSWKLREKFFKAKVLMEKQDMWCKAYSSDPDLVKSQYPEDLELESLVALLRGKVKLNIHAYDSYDMEMLLRTSHEFNVSIAAFHHATSAHLIADRLAKERETNPVNRNLMVAIFADKGFYKTEAYHASFYAPKVFKKFGVPFAFKSDHTVTNAQFLAWQVSKAVHYGLDPNDGLKAITSVPAKALGIANRVGSIREGMDADVVIWNGGNPLIDIGAHPSHVIVDGKIEIENPHLVETKSARISKPDRKDDLFCKSLETFAEEKKRKQVVFTNVAHLHLNKTHYFRDAVMVLSIPKIAWNKNELSAFDAFIECAGVDCKEIILENAVIIDTRNGTIMPSPIAASSTLGLIEISQESVTSAGPAVTSPWDALTMDGGLSVADSLSLGLGLDSAYEGTFSKMLEMTSRAGIGIALASPTHSSSSSVVLGQSVLFYTAADSIEEGAILQDNAAIHIAMGKSASSGNHNNILVFIGGMLDSVSKQVDFLKEVLFRAEDEWRRRRRSPESFNSTQYRNRFSAQRTRYSKIDVNAFISVLKGDLPLYLHADNAEVIAAVLRVKNEVEKETPEGNFINLIIAGGSEAWKVAKEIGKAKRTSVLLTPVNCIPEKYDSRRCQSWSSLAHPIFGKQYLAESGIAILIAHNVPVGVAPSSDEDINALVWDAGWAKWISNRYVDGSIIPGRDPLSLHDSVGLITWSLSEMLVLSNFFNIGTIDVGQKSPNFVVYSDGHPLNSMTSQLIFSMSVRDIKERESLIRCLPKQL